MKKLVLHIGRHKSGTTAIQRFLKANPAYLHASGYLYPGTGIRGFAHHLIAEPMQTREVLKNLWKNPASGPLMKELGTEIAMASEDKVILSSEAFQNGGAEHIHRAFANYDTRVIVYIRNQLDYLTSAYAQKVHASDYAGTLGEYYDNIYSVDYDNFLNSWEAEFPERLTVRKFDRDCLASGDIVTDFCVHGLAIAPPVTELLNAGSTANPSLHRKVVELKRYLNQEGYSRGAYRRDLYRLLPQLNADYGGGSLRAPEAIRADLVGKCLASDSAVGRRYFDEDVLFDYSSYSTVEFEPLESAEREAMLEALDLRLQEQGASLQALRKN